MWCHIVVHFCNSWIISVTLLVENGVECFPLPPTAPPAHAGSDFCLLISWTLSLQGADDLAQAMEALLSEYGAEAELLSRRDNSTGGCRHIVAADVMAGKPNVRALDRSCADQVLGNYVATATEGTIWAKSYATHGPVDPAGSWLTGWCKERRVSQTLVIVLWTGPKFSDFLELHFKVPLSAGRASRLKSLAPALARSWSSRRAGIISQRIHAQKQKRRVPHAVETPCSLLDSSNPAGLTRAEYRVCILLGQGMGARMIANELGVSDTTVRSQLSSIYSKTGTAGQVDLMYRLYGASSVTPAAGRLESYS